MDSTTLGDRLSFLRSNVYPLGGQPYSFEDLAGQLTQNGISVTERHLRNIFDGKVANPSFAIVAGLADIFNVKMDVFSCGDDHWAEVSQWIRNANQQFDRRSLNAARGQQLKNQRAKRARQQALKAYRESQHRSTH